MFLITNTLCKLNPNFMKIIKVIVTELNLNSIYKFKKKCRLHFNSNPNS